MNLGDTAVMVIVIIIAAAVMLVVPMVLMADKVDDATILGIQEAVDTLGNAITTKSEVTPEDLEEFNKRTGTAGVAIDYDLLIKIPDENPAKKQTSEQQTVGDTIYIDLTRTQIESNLPYKIPANSPVHIEAKIVSNNWVETLTGRTGSNAVVASYTGVSK